MRSISLSFIPAAANLTGFATNVTGAAFTLTANSSGDNLAHQVTIQNNSITDHSGKTMLLVGTDADGNSLTETMTGPGASATVTSTGFFKTLLSVTPSASIGADTFNIGWTATSRSLSVVTNDNTSIAPLVQGTITGTINVTVEQTIVNPFTASLAQVAANWQDSAQASKSASFNGVLVAGITACRLKVTSVTGGATITLVINNPRTW